MINVLEWKKKLLESTTTAPMFELYISVIRRNEGEAIFYDPLPRSYEEYRRKYYVRNLP